MSRTAADSAPLFLVCGDDEFAVKQKSREIFEQWCSALGAQDQEILDGTAGNAQEALSVLRRVREALQTLPFFGGAKVVWLRHCNFLGEDRTASSQAVSEALADFAAELKTFQWQNVRLLISAGKVDKRKTFFKTVEKIGSVEVFAGWSLEDRDWADQAELFARAKMREERKEISDEAIGELVTNVGPNPRLLHQEIEKLCLYIGQRSRVELEDVEQIVTRNKQAKAFALGDAVGDRNLPKALKCLDEEFWAMKFDSQRSEIGLLYGLISKFRMMLFVRELMRLGHLKEERDFNRFKAQLGRLPADLLPQDKKFNPLAQNPYVLFRALPQARRFTQEELVRAMELLLECNRKLISSSLDPALVLQQTLSKIIGLSPQRGEKGRPAMARL